jgi:hypothetical protein
VSASLELDGLTEMRSETQAALIAGLAASMGVDPSTVTLAVTDFPVAAEMLLVGLTLDAWNADADVSETAFASGVAADLEVTGASAVEVGEPTESDAPAGRRHLTSGSALSVPFTVRGFGASSGAAAAADARLTQVATSGTSSALASSLSSSGLPVSSLGMTSAPRVSAALSVGVVVTSANDAAAVGASLVAGVGDGSLTTQLAAAGITARPTITSQPHTAFADLPPPPPELHDTSTELCEPSQRFSNWQPAKAGALLFFGSLLLACFTFCLFFLPLCPRVEASLQLVTHPAAQQLEKFLGRMMQTVARLSSAWQQPRLRTARRTPPHGHPTRLAVVLESLVTPLRLFISFWQVVASFSALYVPWPSVYCAFCRLRMTDLRMRSC